MSATIIATAIAALYMLTGVYERRKAVRFYEDATTTLEKAIERNDQSIAAEQAATRKYKAAEAMFSAVADERRKDLFDG